MSPMSLYLRGGRLGSLVLVREKAPMRIGVCVGRKKLSYPRQHSRDTEGRLRTSVTVFFTGSPPSVRER